MRTLLAAGIALVLFAPASLAQTQDITVDLSPSVPDGSSVTPGTVLDFDVIVNLPDGVELSVLNLDVMFTFDVFQDVTNTTSSSILPNNALPTVDTSFSEINAFHQATYPNFIVDSGSYFSFSLTAGTVGTGTLTLQIDDITQAQSGDQAGIAVGDPLQYTVAAGEVNPVPTPTAALAGAGLLGLVALRRRRV